MFPKKVNDDKFTYICHTEFKDFCIVSFFHVFDFPRCCSIMTNSLLLGELDIIKLPSCCNISLIWEIYMNCSGFFDVNFTKIELIHSIIILREEVCEYLHFWSHENSIEEKLLLVTICKVWNEFTLSLIENCHWPFFWVICLWSQKLHMNLNNLKWLQAEHSLNRFFDNFWFCSFC